MKPKYIPFVLLAALIVITACGQGGISSPDAEATLRPQYTAAAQTLQAMLTQSAPQASSTPLPTSTPETIPPTFTATPIPTNTLAPIPTIQPATRTPVSRCDWAQYVTDVSYPDGTIVAGGQNFTKTWRIKNIGTCTWTTGYSIVFIDGNAMGGKAAINLTGAVAPGQTVDISVDLTAPAKEEKYRGNWKLRNANGVIFGLGSGANDPFWVSIVVRNNAALVYDFAANYCDATWRNGNTKLPCPGKDGNKNGYVLHINKPVLESGYQDDEPGLLTVPENIKDGLIQGKYPEVKIKKGDHFKAIVNCEYKAENCNVTFRLRYQIGTDPIKKLGEWQEVYDKKYFAVDLDLSGLAGKKVKFFLEVLANGKPTDDYALWFAPRIVHITPPTPTPKP